MPDRLPPQVQLWTWPNLQPAPPVQPLEPVRIGDAERDEAVSDLGDHFAAGRLTREELDARVDQAMTARYDGDLRPLFVDLPPSRPLAVVPGPPSSPAVRGGFPMLVMWWLPFLLVGSVVAAVVLSAPWLVWGVVWALMMGSFLGRRRVYPGPGHHYRR